MKVLSQVLSPSVVEHKFRQVTVASKLHRGMNEVHSKTSSLRTEICLGEMVDKVAIQTEVLRINVKPRP